jgi:hypothetical protein
MYSVGHEVDMVGVGEGKYKAINPAQVMMRAGTE